MSDPNNFVQILSVLYCTDAAIDQWHNCLQMMTCTLYMPVADTLNACSEIKSSMCRATYLLDIRRPGFLRLCASCLEQPPTVHKTYLFHRRLLKEFEILSVFMCFLTHVFNWFTVFSVKPSRASLPQHYFLQTNFHLFGTLAMFCFIYGALILT